MEKKDQRAEYQKPVVISEKIFEQEAVSDCTSAAGTSSGDCGKGKESNSTCYYSLS